MAFQAMSPCDGLPNKGWLSLLMFLCHACGPGSGHVSGTEQDGSSESLEELLPGTWEGTRLHVDDDSGAILETGGVTFTFGADGTYDSNAASLDKTLEAYNHVYTGDYRVLGEAALMATWWDGLHGLFEGTHVPVEYRYGCLYVGAFDGSARDSYALTKVAEEGAEAAPESCASPPLALKEALLGTWTGTLLHVDYESGAIQETEGVGFTFHADGTYDSNAGSLNPELAFWEYDYSGAYRVLGETGVLGTWWSGDAGSFTATRVPVGYHDGYLHVGTFDHWPSGDSYVLQKVAEEDTDDE